MSDKIGLPFVQISSAALLTSTSLQEIGQRITYYVILLTLLTSNMETVGHVCSLFGLDVDRAHLNGRVTMSP